MTRAKKSAWWILGLMAFLSIVGALAYRMELTRRDVERWEAYEKEARSKGEDLGIKAWLPPEVPDAENFAAHPWIAGICASENSPEGKVVWDWKYWQYDELEDCEGPSEGKSWFEGKPEKVKALLDRGLAHAADFKAIHEAAARTQCWLRVGFNPGTPVLDDTTAEMLARLTDMVKILCVHADAAWIAGQDDTALADLEATLRIANHLRSQNILLLSLAGSTAEVDAIGVLEVALGGGRLSTESKHRLLAAIRTRSVPDELAKVFRVIRGLDLESMQEMVRASAAKPHRPSLSYSPQRLIATNSLFYCRMLDPALTGTADRAAWEAFEKSTRAGDTVPDVSNGLAGILILGTANVIPELFLREERVDGIRKRLAE